MKIICLIKYIPDVENFKYDYERNVLVRENVRMILNPDDACTVAFALKRKDQYPDTVIEVVTMAPQSIIPQLEDLLRLGVDHASLISDKAFVGSDTYVTSRILGRYLREASFDCILTGTHTLDGDTAHVPSQVAELLSLSQMSNVVEIDEAAFCRERAIVEAEEELTFGTYEIALPAVISLRKDRKYKLPYIRYEELSRDVKDRIQIIDNDVLGFAQEEVGIIGSLTQISSTFVKSMEKKKRIIVRNDDEGIDLVYSFLKERGFV
ncbi:electron transfer flavoprotein subunit beta/FixA family protein [Anoxybacterium hadale]|uniref:Electron transfer flavoprotein subunit beta/FixA family protein n=1 Tax=Anoxybacterium hadale TaxID=3408580 RepID=A0ACD1AE92_9FIRM|nr:electron transfer flavoprotein subunit beta/FixA family protein [Clostridiales bacterium]